jgi:hypothetical protein
MNRFLKVLLGLIIFIIVLLGFAYYSLTHIDFIGKKDPEAASETVKRWNSILLTAEYRNGTDYCELNLLDSANLEINIGDSYGGSIVNKQYLIIKDTIKVIGGLSEIEKYNIVDNLLIRGNKLLFRLSPNQNYDTTVTMVIKSQKIKL